MAVRIGKAALLGIWPRAHVVVHTEPLRKGCLLKAERIVFHGDLVLRSQGSYVRSHHFRVFVRRKCVRRARSREKSLETLCSIHDARIHMIVIVSRICSTFLKQKGISKTK